MNTIYKKVTLVIFTIIIIGSIVYFKTVLNNYTPTAYEKELIEYFKEVALNTEYGDNLNRVVKWKTNMIIFISKDEEYNYQTKLINQTIETINEIVQEDFKIELTDDISKSNTILYLCKLNSLSELDYSLHDSINNDFAGFASVEWRNFFIEKAKIFINTEETLELQESTILEEITQSIGILNDSEKYTNSIFYNHQIDDNIINRKYSRIDIDIIRLLYNPKMKAGLNAKQSEKVIKKILKEEKK